MATDDYLVSELTVLGFEVGQIHMKPDGRFSIFVNGTELRFDEAYAVISGLTLDEIVELRAHLTRTEGQGILSCKSITRFA